MNCDKPFETPKDFSRFLLPIPFPPQQVTQDRFMKMAGKPYTSKGCTDCRRRKIKCDEQRPQCGRCLKSRIKCQYEMYRNFIGGASIREATKQQRISVGSEPIKGFMHRRSETTLRSSAAPSDPKLSVVVHSAPAMRAQVFASFIQDYSATGPISLSTNFDDFIFRGIGSLARKSQTTERVLSALSCLFLGKANHNTTIFNHGLYLYQTVIRQVSHMICQGRYTNETLYTVFLCHEIDLIHAPFGLKTYGTHIAGMSSLLQCYGSITSDDPILNTIYNYQQKLRIIFATTGTSLSKAEYDYLMEPTNGDPLLEILQIAVAIGELRSSINAMDSGHANPVAYKPLLQKGYEIQAKLMGLYQDGRLGKEPHRLPGQPRDNMEKFTPESLFGFAYEFSSPNHAFLFVMYWSHLVLLQPLIRRANSLLRPQTGSMTAIESSSPFGDLSLVDPEKYADKVARSMCYCLQGCMRASFAKLAAFALCMISLFYVDAGNREKYDWCLEAIRSLARRGFDCSVHLYKLMAASWRLRWVVGVPETCKSLRESDVSVCDVDSCPLFDSAGGMDDDSVYNINGPPAIQETFS